MVENFEVRTRNINFQREKSPTEPWRKQGKEDRLYIYFLFSLAVVMQIFSFKIDQKSERYMLVFCNHNPPYFML